MTQSFSRMDPFYEEQAAQALLETQEAGGPPETLWEMGQALLDLTVAAALAKGITLPTRQIVYPAPIPADCEQVAVLITSWNPTPAPDGPTICKPWRWMAPLSVIITRCTPAAPKVNKPLSSVTVEAMKAAAKMASDDSEVLLEVLNRLDEVGSDVTVVANAPQGGMQTVELNVSLISGGSF